MINKLNRKSEHIQFNEKPRKQSNQCFGIHVCVRGKDVLCMFTFPAETAKNPQFKNQFDHFLK